jgi:hypothetical protein
VTVGVLGGPTVNYDFEPTAVVAVPEPGMFLLLGFGLVAVGVEARKKLGKK